MSINKPLVQCPYVPCIYIHNIRNFRTIVVWEKKLKYMHYFIRNWNKKANIIIKCFKVMKPFIFSKGGTSGQKFICFSSIFHFVKFTLTGLVNLNETFSLSEILSLKVQLGIIHNSHIILHWSTAVCFQRTIIYNLMI